MELLFGSLSRCLAIKAGRLDTCKNREGDDHVPVFIVSSVPEGCCKMIM